MSKWIDALKLWNAKKGGAWCVPRKGSPEHAEVKALMGPAETKAKKEARGKKEAAEEMAAVPSPKKRKIVISDTPEIDFEKMEREAVLGKATTTAKKEKVKSFLRRALEKRKAKKPAATGKIILTMMKHYKEDKDSYGVMGEMGDDSYRVGRIVRYTQESLPDIDKNEVEKEILNFTKNMKGWNVGNKSQYNFGKGGGEETTTSSAAESKVGAKDVVLTRNELIAELPAITKKDTKVIYPMLYKATKNKKGDYFRYDPGSAAGRNISTSGGTIATRTAAQMKALLEDNFPASAVFDVHTAHEDKNSVYLYMKRHPAASAVGAGAGVEETSSKEKVKAFLKKVMEKRKAKKESMYKLQEGETALYSEDVYEKVLKANKPQYTDATAKKAAASLRTKFPEQADFTLRDGVLRATKHKEVGLEEYASRYG